MAATELERSGEAFEGDVRLTVVGPRLRRGDRAPDFTLDALGPGEAAPREVTLQAGAGRVRLLHVVNSLDTPVCHVGAHRFERMRTADLPTDVDVYTVSMDLPFAQARWREAEHVGHDALSSHRSEDFGRAYGVLLREWRLLQRAVFVIDRAGRIAHAEYVADQMAEPDYDAALAAARSAAGTPDRMAPIRVFVTGGTFDKEYNELTGSLAFKETHLPEMLRLGRSRIDVSIRTLMMIDSLDMSDADRSLIVEQCRQTEESHIVITHGTDTMVETARALASAFQSTGGRTIVLTGAMIPYAFGSSDGLFNLGSALSFVQALPAGIYIAMNGRCFNWDRVRKNRDSGFFETI